jgi:heme/copper-type cytochrome/quinol oxidase subunit 3
MSDLSRALREPWPDLAVQREGVNFGIWVFLASEILFFSALFIIYAVYRSFNSEAFTEAAKHTELFYGTLNTGLLLTSSVTMTIALRAATARLRGITLAMLLLTALLGSAFLIAKGLEYHDDLTKNLFPGAAFPLAPPQTQLFWMMYWIMTGIHAIHLSVGIVVVLTVLILFWRNTIPVQGSTMEGVATYWHFVDSVWLVLYPLLYLVGRS